MNKQPTTTLDPRQSEILRELLRAELSFSLKDQRPQAVEEMMKVIDLYATARLKQALEQLLREGSRRIAGWHAHPDIHIDFNLANKEWRSLIQAKLKELESEE